MKMTKAEAKKECMAEWNDRRKGKISTHSCGYCLIYPCAINRCPLFKLWGFDCIDKRSPFEKWAHARTKKEKMKWADVLYKDIKRS